MAVRMKTAEWQTRTICQFLAATAQTDEGGHKMLQEAAAAISVTLPSEREDDELDRMRGEPEGWVTHEEGMRRMRQSSGAAPADNLVVDGAGNVTGSPMTSEISVEEQAAADSNAPGSFEAFMTMLGGGGMPPPRGPVPA